MRLPFRMGKPSLAPSIKSEDEGSSVEQSFTDHMSGHASSTCCDYRSVLCEGFSKLLAAGNYFQDISRKNWAGTFRSHPYVKQSLGLIY